jgi:hypothetical protein
MPRQPKLRDSCIACSTSKVKCQKEKPTCSRCSERGLTCEYATSKRTGRQSYNARSTASPEHNSLNIALPSLCPAARELDEPLRWQNASTGSVDWSAPCRDQDATETNQEPSDNIGAKTLDVSKNSNVAHACEQKALPSYAQLDDFFKFLMTQMGEQKNFTDASLCPMDVMNNQTSASEDMFLDPGFDAFQALDLDQNSCLVPTEMDFPDVMRLDSSDPSTHLNDQYACVPTGLLTPTSSSCPDRSIETPCSRQESTGSPSGSLISEAAMAKNKHIVDSMINILVCHHSIDERLLTVLSLIACRVIAWYAAVARDESSRSVIAGHLRVFVNSRSAEPKDILANQVRALSLEIGNMNVGEADHRFIAVQSVLGEAHRVQKLADLLSNRLENIRLHNDLACLVEQGRATEDGAMMGQAGASVLAPSVIQTFETLETGLRGRLDSLVSKVSLHEAQDQYQQMEWKNNHEARIELG